MRRLEDEVSRAAKQRAKWFDFYRAHDRNARLTCRRFGISPQTFYRWRRRFDPNDLSTLEDRAKRPRHLRQPTASPDLVTSVKSIREAWPRWGKEKIAALLRDQGETISTSMVGRILKRLKESGQIREAVWNSVMVKKHQRPRPYATRKPRDYIAREPGDIVEIDTMELRPLPGVLIKHFTARDVVSRWDVLEAHAQAGSGTATAFIHSVLSRMPFVVRAVQVDGGSEFEAGFEQECRKLGIKLFVLPPRSPKLNGHVERAHRTHAEEFYQVTDSCFELPDLNRALLAWEQVYSTFRPHQALGYLTPEKFLKQLESRKEEVRCH